MNAIHIGGCILNRSPHEMRGDNCDCFKIRFTACAWLQHHSVQMCREWVKYMASSLPRKSWESDQQSQVIKKAVCDHFSITEQYPYIDKIVPKAKKLIEAVAPLGYVPQYFREVVMCNRYGHFENHISVRWILTEEHPQSPYGGVYGKKGEQLWEQKMWGYEIAMHNRDLYWRFIAALYNLANNKKLTKYKGCNLSYGMNPLQATIKLLQLKTQQHETSEQQEPITLPV